MLIRSTYRKLTQNKSPGFESVTFSSCFKDVGKDQRTADPTALPFNDLGLFPFAVKPFDTFNAKQTFFEVELGDDTIGELDAL
jgi:hypothetical protein